MNRTGFLKNRTCAMDSPPKEHRTGRRAFNRTGAVSIQREMRESGEDIIECKLLIVAGSAEQCYEMLGAWPDYMGCDKVFGLRDIRTGKKDELAGYLIGKL